MHDSKLKISLDIDIFDIDMLYPIGDVICVLDGDKTLMKHLKRDFKMKFKKVKKIKNGKHKFVFYKRINKKRADYGSHFLSV